MASSAVGASWDDAVAELWGSAMGVEFYNKGANVQLGPGVNVNRVPVNGRNFEYLSGEDPLLGYRMTYATVKGIQSQGEQILHATGLRRLFTHPVSHCL